MKKYMLLLAFATTACCNAQTNATPTEMAPDERIEMLQQIGNIYFSEGDPENALDTFQRILAIDPDHKVTHPYRLVLQYKPLQRRHREYDRAR